MITIRRFSASDEKSVLGLITQIMQKEFREDLNAYPTEDVENIQKAYGGIGDAFFVAVDGSQIIGTVAIKKEDDRVALMRRLFVANAYRKQHIGRQLIDRAIQFCDEVGYTEVIFRTTSRMEAASKVVEKRGFTQRAKLQLGPIELKKFSLSIRNGSKNSKVSA